MTADIEIAVDASSTVTRQDIRSALDALTEDDISETSPVTAGCPEAVAVNVEDGLLVRCEGHDGDWTRTSERAVLRALKGASGVEDASVVDGGYESES